VSNGQRLTNTLNELALQGYYQSGDFDELGIPFRAVATDLVKGERAILSSGSLAEAMRASSTIPVMYAALSRDSMLLVDGGLLSNLPVDIAAEHGCDIIIAVNTSSPLRARWEMRNPLETLDQVFTVMMQENMERQHSLADFIITPKLDGFEAADFEYADSLISLGYEAARSMAETIRDTIDAHIIRSFPKPVTSSGARFQVRCTTAPCSGDSWFLEEHSIDEVYRKAVLLQRSENISRVRVTFMADNQIVLEADTCPRIGGVILHGASLLSMKQIAGIEDRWRGSYSTLTNRRKIKEYILEDYRSEGYSLASIDSLRLTDDNIVHVYLSEGRIGKIIVSGNTKTNRVVLLRELPLREGDVFQIAALKRGMNNLAGLNLFHYVTFDIERTSGVPNLILRVVERPSQMLQTGLLVDNERNAQLGILLRDANFLGTGTEIAAAFFSGDKNRQYSIRYNTNRLFYTPFSLSLRGYYGFKDFNNYSDVSDLPRDRFERTVSSVYRSIKSGAVASFGLYVERFGNLLGTIRYEHQRLRTDQIMDATSEIIDEENRIVELSISSTIDTQDRYPYPQTGLFFTAEYASAQAALGGDVAFSRLFATYELYVPVFGKELVAHPRFVFGYGDKTMPRGEEFRIGGLASFIGMRENEFNGRQIAVGSFEVRYRLPVDILFDSYVSLRYDLGRTWANPELVRIEDLRHGAGLVIGLDTPIGPADFAIGKSFYFLRNNTSTPVRWGPTNLYFSIGVELN
jgi:NTE family protein